MPDDFSSLLLFFGCKDFRVFINLDPIGSVDAVVQAVRISLIRAEVLVPCDFYLVTLSCLSGCCLVRKVWKNPHGSGVK